jgi:hypothetical protein
MMPQIGSEDTSWLKFVHHGESEAAISYSGRMAQLVSEMSRKDSQYPSLAFFLGKKTKDDALQQLFPRDHCRQNRRAASGTVINLQLDRSSAHSRHPLLFADCNPSLRPGYEWDEKPSSAMRKFYPWAPPPSTTRLDLLEDILARLLFRFTDVICLFADDCGGLRGARSLLSVWAKRNKQRTASLWRPHVVVASRPSSVEDEKIISSALRDDCDLEQAFTSIAMVAIPVEGDDYSGLSEHLSHTLVLAREERASASVLFSAHHANIFFEKALRHFSQHPVEPFDFVRASRCGNEVTEDLALHLENFFRLVRVHKVPSVAACSFTASAMLIDAYPPGMHGKYSSA